LAAAFLASSAAANNKKKSGRQKIRFVKKSVKKQSIVFRASFVGILSKNAAQK